MRAKSLLKKYYGFSDFWPGQEEIIESILEGRDTLALMPTGGGKSLCYQLPALVLEGVTLVISPLIALMKDQVDTLGRREVPATFINSSLTEKEIKKRMEDVLGGKIKILYVAPERLNGDFSRNLKNIPINMIAVDEAHCVSTWGHDFRPDYRKIKDKVNSLPDRPIISAFTATATPEVKSDIIEQLEMDDPQVFVRGFDRPNLNFYARGWLREEVRDREVLNLVKSLRGPGIIYVGKRSKAEEMAVYLIKKGIEAMPYHAGLKTEERTKIQEAFMENRISVIVATIAFGMGVDKSDIRFVIHSGMPGTLEGYYQEAGRAGRDGKPAVCVLLHSGEDSALQSFFIQKSYEDSLRRGKFEEEAEIVRKMRYEKLKRIEEYATAAKCRRKMILDYFGDVHASRKKKCGNCDYCV